MAELVFETELPWVAENKQQLWLGCWQHPDTQSGWEMINRRVMESPSLCVMGTQWKI